MSVKPVSTDTQVGVAHPHTPVEFTWQNEGGMKP